MRPIKIIIAGVDKFSKKMDRISKKVDKFSKKTNQIGRGMTAGVTVPILGMGFAAGRAAVSFDAAMNRVEAKADVSGKSIADLREQAKLLGRTTRFSATSAAEGMGFLAQAGFDTGKIFKSIGPVLTLAATENMELGRAADITSNIMGGFRLGAEKTAYVVDVLATTTASANVDMEMLGETMKYAAPVAKSFGASLKDTAVIAGFLGNIGIQGSMAGTTMKKMFSGITSGAPKVMESFELLGVKVQDNTGKIRSFADITVDLSKNLAKLPKIEQMRAIETIFGERAKAGFSALVDDVGSADSAFTKLAEKMGGDLTGNAQKMVNIINKGAVGGLQNFMSALEGVAIAIGESGLLEWIAKFTYKMADFFRGVAATNPQLLKFGMIAAGMIAALGPILIITSKVVSAVMFLTGIIAKAGGVAAIFTAIGAKMGVVIAALSGPIGWIILGVAALTAAIVFLGKKYPPVFKLFKKMVLVAMGPIMWIPALIVKKWDKIKPFFKLIGIVVGKVFTHLKKGPVGDFFGWLWKAFKWVVDKVLALFNKIGKAISFVFDGIVGKLAKILGKIVGKKSMREAGFQGFEETEEDRAKAERYEKVNKARGMGNYSLYPTRSANPWDRSAMVTGAGYNEASRLMGERRTRPEKEVSVLKVEVPEGATLRKKSGPANLSLDNGVIME